MHTDRTLHPRPCSFRLPQCTPVPHRAHCLPRPPLRSPSYLGLPPSHFLLARRVQPTCPRPNPPCAPFLVPPPRIVFICGIVLIGVSIYPTHLFIKNVSIRAPRPYLIYSAPHRIYSIPPILFILPILFMLPTVSRTARIQFPVSMPFPHTVYHHHPSTAFEIRALRLLSVVL
ncbi:hypothetical protein PLICRDRAFT_488369 [Plicaturopsis crispa FD-325 SS-3]|nr:hypothetical protein PLICRDRAFT_488369 [Plicaturopsis crispa FD-325 SS-3]